MFDPLRAYEKIRKYPVVSFDIFDTLVKRNVSNPKGIFNVVEKKLNLRHPEAKIHDFCAMRVQAEQEARRFCDREEITFQQIYDQLKLDSQLCMELKQLEEETELKYCQPNYELKKLYDRCVAEGHTVVITSDMYLPREMIIRILHKCGYTGYKKLYLSSEIGLRKRTGNLYDYLLKDLNEPAKNIIHIGDGKRNDNLIPRFKDIKTLYVDRQQQNTVFLDKEDIFKTDDSLFPFLNNILQKYSDKSDLFRWGYETLGPLLLGFTTWVHEQIIENSIDKAYFLARDMYLVLEIYRKLYGSNNVEYLEVSRKSLRAAYVKKKGRLDAVFDTMTRREYTFREVIDALGVDAYDLDIDIDLSVTFSREISLHKNYEKLNRSVLEALNKKENLTEKYLKKMDLFENKKIAVVDIGWHGTIQNMLESLTEKRLLGLYFGNTVRGYFNSMETKGYWFSFNDETMAIPYLSMTYILEVMLFPKIGTTTGYTEKDGDITPEYDLYEMKSCAQIEQIQNGAMTFVSDFLEFEPDVRLIQCNDATKAFTRLAFKPTLIQVKAFSKIPYEDGKVYSLASSRSFCYYLFHPIRLLKDYKAARWKEGFIKQAIPFIESPHRIAVLGRSIKAKIGLNASK